MRKTKKIISLLLCLLMLFSLSSCFQPPDKPGMTTYSETTASSASETTKPAPASSAYTDVVIMSTTDMHGKCWDTDILTDNEQPHSMLKVSSAVSEVRKEFGRNNVILIDNGDIFQGAPESQTQLFQYISGESDEIPSMALCLKEIGYDAFSLGNHEFNYDWDAMNKIYEWFDSNGVPVISGNICYDGSDKTHNAGDCVFEPYTVKEITVNGNAHKVGILGLENCDVTRWDIPDHYPGMMFVQPDNKDYSMAKEAGRYIEKMKQDGCEFIIVTYHGELGSDDNALKFGVNTESQGKRIVSGNDDIAMLITGHDHSTDYSNSFIKDKSGKNVLVVNGGGQEVTKSVFRFKEDESGKLVWEMVSSENLVLDDYKNDEELKNKIAPYAEIAEEKVSEPVGKTSGNWDGNDNFYTESTDTINLVCASVKEIISKQVKEKYTRPSDARADLDHLDIDLVMTNVTVSDNYTVKAGDISYKDIYRIYKFANSVYVIPMTGKEIKDIMEENASEKLSASVQNGEAVFTPVGDSYTHLIFGGLSFEYDLAKRDSSKVSIGSFSNGRTFKDDGVYLVAVNNYILGNENCGLRKFSADDAIWIQSDDGNGEFIQDTIAEYITSKTRINGSVTPRLFNWSWKITYSASTSGIEPDSKDVLAVYEKDPQDEKKYILYHEASGTTITTNASGVNLAGAQIPAVGDYLTGDLPAGALEFTLFYDESFNFTLRDQYGNFLVSSPTGGLALTNKPVEDRYQFWHMEKVDGGYRIYNVGGSGSVDHSLMCSNGSFTTGTYNNTNAFVFTFYEVG